MKLLDSGVPGKEEKDFIVCPRCKMRNNYVRHLYYNVMYECIRCEGKYFLIPELKDSEIYSYFYV